MERIGDFYWEMEAMRFSGYRLDEWIELDWEIQATCMKHFRVHTLKEGYYNTDPKKRFRFFMGDADD